VVGGRGVPRGCPGGPGVVLGCPGCPLCTAFSKTAGGIERESFTEEAIEVEAQRRLMLGGSWRYTAGGLARGGPEKDAGGRRRKDEEDGRRVEIEQPHSERWGKRKVCANRSECC